MYVDTELVREFASTIGSTGTGAREVRTDSGCGSVTQGLPGSSIAATVVTHALLTHTALQQVSHHLADSAHRLVASADIYDAAVDDAAALLVSAAGDTLW